MSKQNKDLLSKSVVEGLLHLGTSIPLDKSKKLIGNCVKLVLNPEATIPPVPEIYATNSVKANQSEYAVVALYGLAVKHCMDGMYLRQLLEEAALNSAMVEELTQTYEEQKKALFMRQLQIGHSLPHITDLQWRIVADAKSSTSDSSSGEIGFYINMGRYKQHHGGERETVVEFVCNTEELQLLINKLREADRHCEKWSKYT